MYLSPQDRDLFFKLYFDLLYCVNEKYKIVESFGNTRFPKGVNTHDAYEIREELFDNLGWIDEYIQKYEKEFNDTELSILISWRNDFVKGKFFVMKNLAKYSVFMSTHGEQNARLFGVTGLNHPISDFYDKRDLPMIADTVILPFKDKIIYDGILMVQNIHIGSNMRNSLNAEYKEAKVKYGIVETLPFTELPKGSVKTSSKNKPVAKSPTKPSQEIYDSIASGIIEFCNENLDQEYIDVSLRMLDKLYRKRPSPLLKGRPNTWACGIVYAVGSNNFLFDKSQSPHMRASDLAAKFGLSQSTAGNKSGEINKILRISVFDPEWTLPGKMADNPFVWMFENEHGFAIDVRYAPREIQEEFFNAGMIPFIPADREVITPSAENSQKIEEKGVICFEKKKKDMTIEGQMSFD